MKKRVWMRAMTALLAVVLLIGAVPLSATAQNYTIYRGQCGDNVEWILNWDYMNIVIEGTGPMWDFTYAGEAPWAAYANEFTNVDIAKGVTSIGDYAFAGCQELSNIILSDSVKSIGMGAFAECPKLRSTSMRFSSLESIGALAFSDCQELRYVDLPATLQQIGEAAFAGCSQVIFTSYTAAYQADATSLVEVATDTLLLETGNLQTVSNKNIGMMAFSGNTRIASLVLAETVETVHPLAFADMPKLKKLTVRSKDTQFGYGVFAGNNVLNEINLPADCTAYYMDQGCLVEAESQTVLAGVKGCEIPEDGSVTAIGSMAFLGTNLSGFVIPDAITEIGALAFGAEECSLAGKFDSVAHTFAYENGIAFAPLDRSDLPNGDFTVIADEEIYCLNGILCYDMVGLVNVGDDWYYVEYGILDRTVETLVPYGMDWYYVKDGKWQKNAETLCCYYDTWYYVKDGRLNYDAETLVQYNGMWFYVRGGGVDWSADTLVQYNGMWFYVRGGMVDWSADTLVQYNGMWFYVRGGMIDWSADTLVQYNGMWFYVRGGMVDWSTDTLVYYNNMWFYVRGGMVDWNAETLCYYNGGWFYVKGGMVDWGCNTLCFYNGAWYYVTGGSVNWGYSGYVPYNGGTFRVVGGVVRF